MKTDFSDDQIAALKIMKSAALLIRHIGLKHASSADMNAFMTYLGDGIHNMPDIIADAGWVRPWTFDRELRHLSEGLMRIQVPKNITDLDIWQSYITDLNTITTDRGLS